MSLIIDALKKAQQLRLKGYEKSPILKYPHPDKKRRKSFKKQWILVGALFISLCLVLLILLRPVFPPLVTQPHRAVVSVEQKLSIPGEEKMSQEPQRDMVIKEENQPILPKKEKDSPDTKPKPSFEKKREEPLIKQVTEEAKEKPTKNILPEKAPSPLPLATPKEDVPPKSIQVEQEGEKNRAVTSEILTLFNSGVTFYHQKEFSKAIQAYQKVIELAPTYIEAYNNLGIIYQMFGDIDKAYEAYRKTTEINPKYEKGYNNLGMVLLLKGAYEEAQEAFQKALTLNSNNIESQINLGILFKGKSQWEKAIESYQKALAIDPYHRETHYNLALVYEQLGNLEQAISHYQQFVQLSTKSHPELVSRVQRHLDSLIKERRDKGK